MGARLINDADVSRIRACLSSMDKASTLEDTAAHLVRAAMDLVPCEHGGYTEVDLHFGRTTFFSSEPEVASLVAMRAKKWAHFMPDHPVLNYRNAHPDVPVVRLSDVTDLGEFYGSGIYNELFREVDTDHQLVMHLGFDPKHGTTNGALPLTLGIPLNRKGRDFSDRDVETLAFLQEVARPVLRQKRAAHQLRLLQRAQLSPELQRSLIGLGLSPRQAEVAFWILKGKSNTDVGTILDIGSQTVRQHSIAIYRKLGVGGRMDLMRTVLQSLTSTD